MGLVNRLARIPEPGQSPGDVDKIPISGFHAHLWEMAQGERTRADIISAYDLVGDDITELDWIIGKYNALPNAASKAAFVDLLYIIMVLAEDQVPGYATNAELVARINRG